MRSWRVGSFSMGIVLIGMGVMVLLSLFSQVNMLKYIMIVWPLSLICVGIEILLHLFLKKQSDVVIKYDALSIVFVSLLMVVSIVLYGILSYTGLFEDRAGFLQAHAIKLDTFSEKYSEKLTGADKLSISARNVNLKVIPSDAADIEVDYFINSSTNNKEFAKEYCDKYFEFQKGSETKMISVMENMNFYRYMDSPEVNIIVRLPKNKTLDLSDFKGSSNYDNDLNNQILTYVPQSAETAPKYSHQFKDTNKLTVEGNYGKIKVVSSDSDSIDVEYSVVSNDSNDVINDKNINSYIEIIDGSPAYLSARIPENSYSDGSLDCLIIVKLPKNKTIEAYNFNGAVICESAELEPQIIREKNDNIDVEFTEESSNTDEIGIYPFSTTAYAVS